VNCPFKNATEFLYGFSHLYIMIPAISSLSNLPRRGIDSSSAQRVLKGHYRGVMESIYRCAICFYYCCDAERPACISVRPRRIRQISYCITERYSVAWKNTSQISIQQM